MKRRTLYITLGIVTFVISTTIQVVTASAGTSTHPSLLNTVASAITGIITIIGIIAAIVGVVSAIRSRARRRSLEARISDNAPISSDKVAESPEFAEDHARLVTEDLRLKEYRSKRDEAEDELRPYLPPNPRGAKRLINHERLYVQIAEERKIFGGEPELTYSHLAKWILIVEHWPRLGDSLTRDPDKMEILEKCASVEDLQKELKLIDRNIRATDEMFSVFGNAVPLSPILGRLVRFEPSATTVPGTTNPVPEANEIGISDAALAPASEDNQIEEVPARPGSIS